MTQLAAHDGRMEWDSVWPPAGADLVVLDLDGTLISLDVDWGRVRGEVGMLGQAAGIRTPDLRVLPLLDISRRLCMHALERDIETTIRRHELRGAINGTVMTDVVEAVLDLPPWVTVAVLCSNSRRAAERAIDRCGLGRRVATCLGRDDLAHRKPEPDGLIELMSRFSVVRSRAVMVGDSADDLLCARRAGVHAIDVRELRRGRLRAA